MMNKKVALAGIQRRGLRRSLPVVVARLLDDVAALGADFPACITLGHVVTTSLGRCEPVPAGLLDPFFGWKAKVDCRAAGRSDQMGEECRKAHRAVGAVRPVRKVLGVDPSDRRSRAIQRGDDGNSRPDDRAGGQEPDAGTLKGAADGLGVVSDGGPLSAFEVGYGRGRYAGSLCQILLRPRQEGAGRPHVFGAEISKGTRRGHDHMKYMTLVKNSQLFVFVGKLHFLSTISNSLAGAVIPVRVDIGFGDHVYPPPKWGNFPSLLPELPEANILMYPPETVVAEKFEAMIRFGEANGRLKDFHDIWVTARTFSFDLPTLVEAVNGTLRRRGTPIPTEMPVGLTEAFAAIAEDRGLWSGFLRRNPPTLKPPPFAELQDELRRFFAPVITSLGAPEGANGRWDPNGGAWR